MLLAQPYSQQRGTHCPWEMQAERLHSNGSKALRLLPSKVISQHNDACLWKLSNPKRPMTENPHWAAIQLHDSSGPSVSAPAASKSSSNSYFFSRPADAPHYSAHALPDATLQDKALMTEPGDAVSYLSDRPQVVTVTRGSRGRKFEPRCLGARTQSQKTSGLYKSPMIRNHSKVKMLGGIRAQRTVRCLDSAPYCPPKRRYTTLPSDLVDKVQMEVRLSFRSSTSSIQLRGSRLFRLRELKQYQHVLERVTMSRAQPNRYQPMSFTASS